MGVIMKTHVVNRWASWICAAVALASLAVFFTPPARAVPFNTRRSAVRIDTVRTTIVPHVGSTCSARDPGVGSRTVEVSEFGGYVQFSTNLDYQTCNNTRFRWRFWAEQRSDGTVAVWCSDMDLRMRSSSTADFVTLFTLARPSGWVFAPGTTTHQFPTLNESSARSYGTVVRSSRASAFNSARVRVTTL